MFVAWSGPTASTTTSDLTSTTLTAEITLNLYNTKLDTVNTFLTAGAKYTFMPYLTFFNTDSSSVVTRPFDAWVVPIQLTVDGAAATVAWEYTSSIYSTPDWIATDYNTLSMNDGEAAVGGSESLTVTNIASGECPVTLTYATATLSSKTACVQ